MKGGMKEEREVLAQSRQEGNCWSAISNDQSTIFPHTPLSLDY
jgi:hypothetical protein